MERCTWLTESSRAPAKEKYSTKILSRHKQKTLGMHSTVNEVSKLLHLHVYASLTCLMFKTLGGYKDTMNYSPILLRVRSTDRLATQLTLLRICRVLQMARRYDANMLIHCVVSDFANCSNQPGEGPQW